MKEQKTIPSLGELVSLSTRQSFEAGIWDDETTSRFLWGIRLNGDTNVWQMGNPRTGSSGQSQAPVGLVNPSSAPLRLSSSDESVEERTRKLFLPYE